MSSLDGPVARASWSPLPADDAAAVLADAPVRWWLSGGVALDRWLGHPIRPRTNIDVSVVANDLAALVGSLPARWSAWAPVDDAGTLVPFAEVPPQIDLQPVLVRDDVVGAWAMQVNVEDGTSRTWVYKRDPRLQLPWDSAMLDIGGIPTGAPEVQLVWKALRPRPEDDIDKAATLPRLSDEARAWWEKCILTIHPHSTWSIHVRSPFAPAKASWTRKNV